jgi:lipoprotein-anchoring transpeptidase ErfK/SrfK
MLTKAPEISRRSFLKLCALSLGGLAFRPLSNQVSGGFASSYSGDSLLRVAIHSVSVYSQPNDQSMILYQRNRDELVNSYYEVISPDGPGYNPRWYRVWGGYIHSAYVQQVKVRPNPILSTAPEKPIIAEVTVPISQTMRQVQKGKWEPVYRLYYGSVQWIVGIDPGPDGTPWYRLRDELLEVEYHVPGGDLRPIPNEEIAPLSPDIPPEKKRIEVSLATQTLTAFEYDQVVFKTKISSGIPNRELPGQIPTKTPTGEFHIENKMPSKHMGDGQLTSDYEAYELLGVPWTSFFYPKTGVAFHGTYWHDNFGVPMSHGCVNMKIGEAKWIYRWSTPVVNPDLFNTIGYGTYVIVH